MNTILPSDIFPLHLGVNGAGAEICSCCSFLPSRRVPAGMKVARWSFWPPVRNIIGNASPFFPDVQESALRIFIFVPTTVVVEESLIRVFSNSASSFLPPIAGLGTTRVRFSRRLPFTHHSWFRLPPSFMPQCSYRRYRRRHRITGDWKR